MADFEEKLRKAFDAEAKQSPAPPNLRYRVVSKAVATPRRASWAAWLSRPRLATVGAVAAVLLISGIGFRVATQSRPIVGQPSPTASPITQLAFGPLPAASLHPPVGLGGGGGASTVEPYFGPATMTWAGTLPEVPASAPVDRFAIPTISDADAFAARLGGRVVSAGSATEAREYQLPGDYKLLIDMSNPVAGEPTFIINRQTPGGNQQQPLTEAAARAAADAELTRLNLAPSWKSAVTVFPFSGIGQAAPVYVVQYQRLIDVTTTLTAGEVDGNADPSGLQVMVEPSGKVGRISGAIRLSLQPAMYPLRPPSTTVNDALHQQPLVDPTAAPQTVTLTKATLVYRVVSAGTVGYLEPAYLFTGRFTFSGAINEKRVLVPALAPRALS
jgi:hypothetical protein